MIIFWGRDHTTNTGRMMIVNGWLVQRSGSNQLPSTQYHVLFFSAWALSMNNAAPFAQLQFSVNGSPIGVSAVLIAGSEQMPAIPTGSVSTEPGIPGPSTSAVCSIVDLQVPLVAMILHWTIFPSVHYPRQPSPPYLLFRRWNNDMPGQ